MNTVTGRKLFLEESMLVARTRRRLLGLVGANLGFCRLAGKAERRSASGSASRFGNKAQTSFGAPIKFALDVTWAIKLLKMLHVDMTKARVIEKQFFL